MENANGGRFRDVDGTLLIVFVPDACELDVSVGVVPRTFAIWNGLPSTAKS